MADVGRAVYLDSSALIKLIVPEAESEALRHELRLWGRFTSSALVRTEVVRAATRVDLAARDLARRVVSALSLIAVTDEILDRAGSVDPPGLRSLDALHLASALSLGEMLGAVVAYDARLADAARSAKLEVLTPGSSD